MKRDPNEPLQTGPARCEDINDNILIEAFTREIVKQGERFDELTKALFSVELTIPGIYAAILQLIVTKENSLAMPLLALTILFWAIALAITLFSFFPKKYSVMPNVVSWKEKRGSADSLTIKEFYEKSADDKRNYLIASSISFFLGIICAGLTVII